MGRGRGFKGEIRQHRQKGTVDARKKRGRDARKKRGRDGRTQTGRVTHTRVIWGIANVKPHAHLYGQAESRSQLR